MRRTIFDIFNDNFNLNDEICILDDLFNKGELMYECSFYTLKGFFDKIVLPKWKYRSNGVNDEQIRRKLNVTSFDIKRGLDKFSSLLYLEYMSNVVKMLLKEKENTDYWNAEAKMLSDNLKNVIENLNYEIKELDKEQIILVEKNPAATAVAEIIEPQYAYDVIEYNHFLLKGDLERKKLILKNLADKFEEIRKEIVLINKDLTSDTGYLLNNLNIRHNNMGGPKKKDYVADMSSEELEKWYDETYQKLLLCILTYEDSLKKDEFKELKRKIQG